LQVQLFIEDPDGLELDTGQATHPSSMVVSEKVLGGHLPHSVDPLALNDPEGQFKHPERLFKPIVVE